MALNIVKDIDARIAVKHVLMSVSDKTGLEEFVPALVKACPGVKIYSTGGTYVKVKEILGADAEGTLVAVSDYTGQPEMQGGLVKTLDFKIYLGLLSETYNDAHQADLKRLSAQPIDMVVVNLYPFQQTVAKEGVTPEMARTNITRFKLMKKAFAHTAAYDTAIAGFFTKTPWAEVDGTYTQH